MSSPDPAAYVLSAGEARKGDSYEHPERSSTVVAVDKLVRERSATIDARISEVEDVTTQHQTSRSIVMGDDTAEARIDFRPADG